MAINSFKEMDPQACGGLMPVLLKVVHTSAGMKGDSKPAWGLGLEASLSLQESVSVGSREWALGVPVRREMHRASAGIRLEYCC